MFATKSSLLAFKNGFYKIEFTEAHTQKTKSPPTPIAANKTFIFKVSCVLLHTNQRPNNQQKAAKQ